MSEILTNSSAPGVLVSGSAIYTSPDGYIADWEDEHCDLTFDEIADLLGMDEEDVTITRNPKLTT